MMTNCIRVMYYNGFICRCVKLQEDARFLVRPDVIRRMDELKRLADDVESRVGQVRAVLKIMAKLKICRVVMVQN